MATTAGIGARDMGGLRLPERYQVFRRVASGGMATVWCAEDSVLGRSVAIKVLSEAIAHDPAARGRFKREARTAAHLSGHPHIVTIYDVGEADVGPPFIVMEYLDGGSVAKLLRLKDVKQAEAVRWLHEAAAGIDYAHGRGVIHRDIKPANFLLDGQRSLHVADFGIARLGTEDTITKTGDVLGTAAYIAPERALGGPATEASDRYAFAVSAFELLVGERPFTAGLVAAQVRQHLEAEPPRASERNPARPPALDAVLARGMAKRPEDRFSSAGELADAIQRSLSARPTRPIPRETAATKGRPGTKGVAALSGVAALNEPAQPERAVSRETPRPNKPDPAWTPLVKSDMVKRPRRGLAVAALAAAILVVAAVALLAQSGSTNRARVLAGTKHRAATAAKHHARARSTAGSSRTTPAATASTPAAATPTPAQSAAPTPAQTPALAPGGSSASGQSADALEAQGHQLMLAGNYSAAIPVLRQAVATASPSSLTYAYALYDLGHSLRMSGDPAAALPILRRRLEIPDQLPVVRAEYQAALRAAHQG